jgi:hypothetical protein
MAAQVGVGELRELVDRLDQTWALLGRFFQQGALAARLVQLLPATPIFHGLHLELVRVQSLER